jgi:aspartokinase/homoserine dehydrogenase 1
LPAESVMDNLHLLDASMARHVANAQTQGCVLRHVASLDAKGHASVRLAMLPSSHPFAHTRLTDNVVQFTTHRYRENPMLVQGPGAGPEVTAAGVFADLLRIAESLEVRR